ncbi:MAG: lipopolysaccharide transport periplasmic protein LptA [Neomegalonema sp.]|nr:lipopolysaccharide transport periplasmic protein LptA [Neomegalonema sp.]
MIVIGRRMKNIAARSAQMFAAALCFTLVAASGDAVAQAKFGTGFGHDTSKPIEVAADSLEVRNAANSAVFRGRVRVKQGAVRMTAKELHVTYAKGGKSGAIDKLRALGDVLITNGKDAATAKRADYNVKTGKIIMTGDVLLLQDPNAISGDRLIIDLPTGRATMKGRITVKIIRKDGAKK